MISTLIIVTLKNSLLSTIIIIVTVDTVRAAKLGYLSTLNISITV